MMYMYYWKSQSNAGKEYQLKRDMKTMKEKIKIYRVCFICLCVLGWFYLALTAFPK